MLERITFEVPLDVKQSLRKECFEQRTTYRRILNQMLFDRYGLRPESTNNKAENDSETKVS